MPTKYQVTLQEIGVIAHEALQDNMLILFKIGAPDDIVDYCFVHSHDQLKQALEVGDQLQINEEIYPLTAVGEVANENLAQLGHITLFFDGANQAQFPGSVHLQGKMPSYLKVGSTFRFFNLS